MHMVPEAIQHINQLLAMARQSGFHAGALSKQLKISPRQLRRYTHDYFGCSPQAWLDQQRLHLAGDLLKEHRCIKTVAFQLGFKRVSHFSRKFKSHYGVCPTGYIGWHDRQNLPHPAAEHQPPQFETELTALLAGSLAQPPVDRIPPPAAQGNRIAPD